MWSVGSVKPYIQSVKLIKKLKKIEYAIDLWNNLIIFLESEEKERLS